ncbi:MAG TPA: phosphoglycerate mutase family protein [Acidimicrobiales bacterium]
MTVLLVRHAVAVARRDWEGDDSDRPLSARGHRQADALVDLLAPFAIDVIFTSRATRCAGTVAPLASSRGIEPQVAPALFEGQQAAGLALADVAEHVVLCSHGDVLPALLGALAGHLDGVPDDPPYAKGATWLVEREGGRVTAARYLAPPA